MYESIDQDIKSWIKDGLAEKSVLRRLEKKGVPEQIAYIAYVQALREYDKDRKKRLRPIYGGITLLLIVIAFFVLPITLTGKSPFLVGGLSGLVISFFVVQTIDCFESFSDFAYKMQLPGTDKSIKTPVIVMVLLPVVLWFVLAFYYPSEVDREIQNHGVNVMGTVTNGISQTSRTRRSTVTTNTVYVSFKLKSGKTFQGTTEVSDADFGSTFIGEEVAVRYSKKHPEFFKIVVPKKELDFEELQRQMMN